MLVQFLDALTSSIIGEASNAPTRAHIEQVPTDADRTTVGNISAVKIYTIENAADAPSFPMFAKTSNTICKSVTMGYVIM